MPTVTLLHDGEASPIEAAGSGSRLLLDAGDLELVTGWALKPEGLCRGDICVPLREGAGDGRVDVGVVARALHRPLVHDAEEGVAALGASAGDRADRLTTLEAPDFTLPDLDGRRHALSDQRGRKVLLVVYASW